MKNNELKMRVAQNCPEYESKDTGFLSSMTELSESCNNCINFINEKCVKDLFDDVKEQIRQN